jgi:hypothetical protein
MRGFHQHLTPATGLSLVGELARGVADESPAQRNDFAFGCIESRSRKAVASGHGSPNQGYPTALPDAAMLEPDRVCPHQLQFINPVAEDVMQSRGHAINADTLHRLQDIYEAAWDQLLRRKSRHTFPWAAESTRFLLARVVLEHARDYRNPIDIVKDVVERIDQQ